jgi:hypothetical protein
MEQLEILVDLDLVAVEEVPEEQQLLDPTVVWEVLVLLLQLLERV